MKKVFKIWMDFSNQMKEDNLSSFASSCAFFTFLSIIPMIMLVLAILPYTPIDPDIVTEWILREFPAGTGQFFVSILEEISSRSIGLISVTAIATLWSAGKGVNSLINGFNAVDKYVDKRNWVVLRLISSLYTLIFLVGLIVLALFMVGGTKAMDHLLVLFPNLSHVVSLLLNFRTLISTVLLSLIFMLCYSLLPYKKHKFRETFFGAIISGLAWTGFSYIFSFYVNRFNAFSMYGSLTMIIVILVWLYFCMYILFIGDNLNKYLSPVYKVLFTKGTKLSDVKGTLTDRED